MNQVITSNVPHRHHVPQCIEQGMTPALIVETYESNKDFEYGTALLSVYGYRIRQKHYGQQLGIKWRVKYAYDGSAMPPAAASDNPMS